jgi:hypothetical protein
MLPSGSKAGGTGERNYEFGLMKYVSSYFEGIFNMPKKSYTTWERRLYFSSKGRCAADLYRPQKSTALGRV